MKPTPPIITGAFVGTEAEKAFKKGLVRPQEPATGPADLTGYSDLPAGKQASVRAALPFGLRVRALSPAGTVMLGATGPLLTSRMEAERAAERIVKAEPERIFAVAVVEYYEDERREPRILSTHTGNAKEPRRDR